MFTKKILSMYSKTILLVDDSPLFIRLAKDCLRREQVYLLTATNGPDAVAAVMNEKPDLVFMDLYMPGGDGDEACKKIKSDDRLKATPIVIMTSSDNPIHMARCLTAGCDEIIHKPLTRELLLETCKKYLKFPGWSGKRTKIETPAILSFKENQTIAGNLSDISVGGVFIETDEFLPVNSELQLEFQLDQDSILIRCKGRVAWANRDGNNYATMGMGIEFIDIKKLDIMSIQAWIRDATSL